MALNPRDIEILTEEVGRAAGGGRVQKVRDGREGEVWLALRRPGQTVGVLIAAGHPQARLHLTTERPTRRPQPTAFTLLLRKHLSGSRLVSVAAYAGDRLARLDFAARDEAGGQTPLTLLAELSGRHGNLFLLDGQSLILGALRANVSHKRDLVVGRPWVAPAPPPESLSQAPATLPTEAPSRTLEARVDTELTTQVDRRAHQALARDIKKQRRRFERRLQQIERDWERAQRAEELQSWGELLQSAWGQVPRGAESVTVTDYYDPDLGPVDVPLDPALSLADNVARYFKEAKRLGRAREVIAERRDQTRATLDRLVAAAARVTPELDAEATAALRDELLAEGLLPRPRPTRQRARGASQPALPYWTFQSSAGLPILVGKSARDNDTLTLHVARGRDLWLHVDETAGSHVVIRLDRGREADGQTLLEAALLAAHYSKRREEEAVDVRYTERKHVTKPKGVGPGRVTVAGARTIRVRRDPELLQRLFDSRDSA